jgi:hypothetical protein
MPTADTITVERKIVKHRGYEIVPRNEASWPEHDRYGYWVVKNHTNVMPGACWFQSVSEAIKGINMLELAKGDVHKFWLLMGHSGHDAVADYGSTEHIDGRIEMYIRKRDNAEYRRTYAYNFKADVYPKDGIAEFIYDTKPIQLNAEECLALSLLLRDAGERLLGKKF